ncbi:MAG TPA: methyltransferase domain-containing protein, partial [Pseudomonadales bacterium]|nr:methyltransferase domain-containing protein [Pseudomonadales bacterium]
SETLQPEALTAVDIAEGMLAACAKRGLPNMSYVCADAEELPHFSQGFDLVFSNFALQWCPSIETAFTNIKRSLTAAGQFAFSIPAADTLVELKQAWAQVDSSVHVNEFYSEPEIHSALRSAAFENVNLQVVEKVLFYPSPLELMRELKSLGAHNVHAGRNIGLTGKQHFKQMLQAYEGFRREQGVPATWRVLVGLAG